MSTNMTSPVAPRAFDVQRVRRDFPILNQRIHGKPLVYLDNAATTQKPQAVIDAMVRSYAEDNANIHRGVHLLSERATQAYEEAREKVQRFLNARERARDHLRARHDRSHQPRRADLRPRQHRQGRRGAHHRDGAPLEHRALADDLRGKRRPAQGRCRLPTRASCGWTCSTGC